MGVPYAELIGDPVGHSKSPLIHKFWLEKLGMEADYRALSVSEADLPRYLSSRRTDPDWRGCNVTMPLKRSVLPFVGRLDKLARMADAVNAIVPASDGIRQGYNTDVVAVRDLLQEAGFSSYRGQVATYLHIVGTGGAARGAAIGAVEAGYSSLDVYFFGRNVAKARALAGLIPMQPEFGFEIDALGGTNIPENEGKPQRYSAVLINASPLGMSGVPDLDGHLDKYHPDTIVFDMVYDPPETSLLREARLRGMKTIDGLRMLVAQAAPAFELFFGRPAPREHDDELRELLTS